jgi:hypothetical protein
MQYLLMLFNDETAWPRMTREEQERGLASYLAYTEALKNAGVYRSSSRLQGTRSATTVRVTDGKTEVIDGPYVDSKEQLGGYFLIEAPDLDAAISWAARCPGASHGTIEVRPLWTMPPNQGA